MLPLLLTGALAGAPTADPAAMSAIEAAIVEALKARLGAGATIVVTRLAVPMPPTGEVSDAQLAPGAMLGAPLSFVLRGPVTRGDQKVIAPVGRAVADVEAAVPHWHATHALTRGSRLTETDLARVTHTLPRGAVKALPDLDALVDGRALADLAADACLTARAVTPSPAVVAGRDVAAVVRSGGIEVRALLVAVDSGVLGAEVRVMHRDSRRTFRARVVGRAEVEISHEP